MLIDQYGRSFKTLRISLIDTCNFACLYCTDDNMMNHHEFKNQISLASLLASVAKLHQVLDLKSVRLESPDIFSIIGKQSSSVQPG